MLKRLLLSSILYIFLSPVQAHKYYEPVDTDKMCNQAKQAYLHGDNLQAQYIWGAITIKGCCGEGNLKEGSRLIEDAARKGNRDAIYHYAQLVYDYDPNRKDDVPQILSEAANLGQLNALAYYGHNSLNLGNIIESCIYYRMAITQNPVVNQNMSDVWKDTYSMFHTTYQQLSESTKSQCEYVAGSWIPGTDVHKHVGLYIHKYLNRL